MFRGLTVRRGAAVVIAAGLSLAGAGIAQAGTSGAESRPILRKANAHHSASKATPACTRRWRRVASPNLGSGHNQLGGVDALSADNVWAVGNAESGSVRHTLVEHFDGSSWTVVPSPDGDQPINYLTDVAALAPNDVWAVGFTNDGNGFSSQSFTLIEHYDGSSWSVVPSPNPIPDPNPGDYDVSNELYSIYAASPDDIWAVGHTFTVTGEKTLMLHWDGSSWSSIDAPFRGRFSRFNSIDGTSGDDIWAVGEWDNGLQRTFTAHFDGTQWSQVPSPNDGNFVQYMRDVSASSPDDVWVVGYHLAVFGVDQVYQTSSFHWDGTAWSVVDAPDQNRENNYLFAVAALPRNNAVSVGFWDTTASLLTLTEHWNGSEWRIVPSPSPDSVVSELVDVDVAPNAVWAVGDYFDGISYRTMIQRFSCA